MKQLVTLLFIAMFVTQCGRDSDQPSSNNPTHTDEPKKDEPTTPATPEQPVQPEKPKFEDRAVLFNQNVAMNEYYKATIPETGAELTIQLRLLVDRFRCLVKVGDNVTALDISQDVFTFNTYHYGVFFGSEPKERVGQILLQPTDGAMQFVGSICDQGTCAAKAQVLLTASGRLDCMISVTRTKDGASMFYGHTIP